MFFNLSYIIIFHYFFLVILYLFIDRWTICKNRQSDRGKLMADR